MCFGCYGSIQWFLSVVIITIGMGQKVPAPQASSLSRSLSCGMIRFGFGTKNTCLWVGIGTKSKKSNNTETKYQAESNWCFLLPVFSQPTIHPDLLPTRSLMTPWHLLTFRQVVSYLLNHNYGHDNDS